MLAGCQKWAKENNMALIKGAQNRKREIRDSKYPRKYISSTIGLATTSMRNRAAKTTKNVVPPSSPSEGFRNHAGNQENIEPCKFERTCDMRDKTRIA